MIAGAAREARAGRSKAREISRKVARLHRAPRAAYEELSGVEDVTLLVLGGVALIGGGYLIYRAMQPGPSGASGSPPGPPGPAGPPGTNIPPAVPPVTNPNPPAGVSWPASALPWNPPSTPANLPVGYTVLDDLSVVDPMFVAMAQSALLINGRSSTSTILKYTGPVDGQVSAALTDSLISLQTQMIASYTAAGSAYPGTKPHADGTLDAKTLAALMSYALLDAAVSGSVGAPGYTSDPIIINMAYSALTNIVNTPSLAALLPGVSLPITPAAFRVFQTSVGQGLPTVGLQNGQIDWATWGVAVGIAG